MERRGFVVLQLRVERRSRAYKARALTIELLEHLKVGLSQQRYASSRGAYCFSVTDREAFPPLRGSPRNYSLVHLGRLELPTPDLSGPCANQLRHRYI